MTPCVSIFVLAPAKHCRIVNSPHADDDNDDNDDGDEDDNEDDGYQAAAGGWVGWSVGWLVDWSASAGRKLVGRLVGQSVSQPIVWLVGRLVVGSSVRLFVRRICCDSVESATILSMPRFR